MSKAYQIKEHFTDNIELWLSGLGLAIIIWAVPSIWASEADVWKIAAVTAIGVGLAHGLIFWVVRKRRQKIGAGARSDLQAHKEALEARVEEQTRQVRALASALTLAEQRERQAISYLLHDDLQQQLYGIQMRAQFLKADVPQGDEEALREQAEAICDALGEAIRRTRTLAIELNPPVLPEGGLQTALEWLAHQMEEEYGLDVHVAAGTAAEASEEMRVLLVRLVRELLFNIVQHAGVNKASVRLSEPEPGWVQIEVEDQGVGFEATSEAALPPAGEGLGLRSVRERLRLFGGRLQIDAQPGRGTRATLLAPLIPSGAPTPLVHAHLEPVSTS